MQLHPSDPSLHHLRGHGGLQSVAVGAAGHGYRHGATSSAASQQPSVARWLREHVLTQAVPAHFCLVLCVVCLWAGASMRLGEEVPSPGELTQQLAQQQKGGLHPVSGASRSLLLLSNEAQHKEMVEKGPSTEVLENVLQHYEHIALNRSGFLSVRPAFPKVGDSGEDNRMRVIPFQVISWYPRITYYPGFLSPSQTEHLAKLALARLAPSDLAYRPGESIPETQDVRTSTGCFLRPEEDKDGVLWEVAEKIASVTHLPVENGEAFNVLRYLTGQHYDSHMDSFDPKDFGKQSSQRIATFLTFLRAPEEGGETVFKREGERNANLTIQDWRTCSDGLGIKVKPKVGDAVLFWSSTPDLQIDPRALHGACPVVKGEKISMARWIREKPIGPRRRRASPRT